MGSDPLKEHEPSPEPITALRNRIVNQAEPPYANFSVLTPFGRRAQRTMKAKGFMLQEDRSWKQLEVPGPPNFESWDACWEIYKTALLMLEHLPNGAGVVKFVMTWTALDEYHSRVVRLHKTFPECWHLIMAAEDRCRSEHLERCRRSLSKAASEGRLPMDLRQQQQQLRNLGSSEVPTNKLCLTALNPSTKYSTRSTRTPWCSLFPLSQSKYRYVR